MNCADEYRKNIVEDRRDSLSFCNIEGKFQCDFQAEVNADEYRMVKNDFINSIIDGMSFVSIICHVSDQKAIGKNRLILKMQSVYVQIRVHLYNIHWLMERGLSYILHVSIRQEKNDFINYVTLVIGSVPTVQTSSEHIMNEKQKMTTA